MGFFPTNTTESAARSSNQYTTNFNNSKFKSHGYSHVCHQAISGEVYVCRYGQSLELLSHNNPPSRLPIPIHLSHLTPIYHFLHQLSVPHPQGVSWKETGNICFVLPSPRQGKNPEVYNYFGQDSIFIIEKEIEVEMKAELYSFLLENKFKNGVMYIKSMHEFVVKYDMAESVEEESLMRGFQRWRKKMKK